jgi:hypothetical protein
VTAATSITGLSVSDSFTLLDQKETVKGQVTDGGIPVSGGQVTISDGGQTQTVGVDGNGNFQATFTFSLAQEFTTAKPHSVTASYGGATVGTTTFATSSGSTNAPNNTLSLLFQLLFLDALFMQLGL